MAPQNVPQHRVRRLINELVRPLRYPSSCPLEVTAHFVKGEPIAPAEALAADYQPFQVGQAWGGMWSTAWFRLGGRVPDEWAGSQVVARIGLGYHELVGFGGEGIVFDGVTPAYGLNPRHDSVVVASPAKGGEPVDLCVEAAANPYHPWGGLEWPLLMPDYEGAPLYRLERAELAVHDTELEAAYCDLRVLFELATSLPGHDRRAAEIMASLDQVALGVDLGHMRDSLLTQRPLWAPLLESPAPQRSHRVTAVGHAHIDSAWLWPLRETRRKCARTFSTAIALMADNPDYVFVCSQAQQHAWMERQYPTLFERMKEKVAAGQFEPVGSMWVEPDTNLPSGESLVRQLVYGKRFFLDHYGVETEDCWLPDAFGYSASLPQILRSAGVRYFLTQKLSWNEVDRFPHHTFWWEGIDGSQVLAHCPPTDTYNGDFRVAQLLTGEWQFAQHAVSHRSLYAFGYGDGGGGPTPAMLDRYERVRDLDPMPRVELGTAKGFFRGLEAEAEARSAQLESLRPGSVPTAHAAGVGGLPVWVGELYLEKHRAVHTTQAKGKLGNRRSESLLREAELWASVGLADDYPQDELERAWEIVLLLQFHDILPGSSIHWVHQETEADYVLVAQLARDVIERATAAIGRRVIGPESAPAPAPASAPASAPAGGRAICVFNAGSGERRELVTMDPAVIGGAGSPSVAVSPEGDAVPVQELADGRLGFVASVPGLGWSRYELGAGSVAAGDQLGGPSGAGPTPVTIEVGRRLSNGLLSVEVDDDGCVTSLFDEVRRREALAPGERGNVLQLHYDLPYDADAWDVDQGTFDRAVELPGTVESIEAVESGPVRAAIKVVRVFGASRFVQTISLAAGADRVEFDTEVEWAERHQFLKVAFPVSVRSPHATYEVQFGSIERPTHANTSWDAARFEVAAQRWADLSEPGFGVALLNDCKYGYDIRANVMRLSLLRGPTWPDPEADMGSHRFAYAVMPHGGFGGDGALGVIRAGEAFNLPLRAVAVGGGPGGGRGGGPAAGAGAGAGGAATAGGPLARRASVVEVEGAMVSAVKRADRGDQLVVRLWEPLGAPASASVRAGDGGGAGPFAQAALADSLEREGDPVALTADGGVGLGLRAFELVTLSFTRQG